MEKPYLLKLLANGVRLVVVIFAIYGLIVFMRVLSAPEQKLAPGCYKFEDIVACGEVDRLCVRGVGVPLDCRPSWSPVDVVMMDVTADERISEHGSFDQ